MNSDLPTERQSYRRTLGLTLRFNHVIPNILGETMRLHGIDDDLTPAEARLAPDHAFGCSDSPRGAARCMRAQSALRASTVNNGGGQLVTLTHRQTAVAVDERLHVEFSTGTRLQGGTRGAHRQIPL